MCATGRGVNTGSIFGAPPTERRSKITVLDQLRFRDGRLVEHLGVPDQLGLLVQLGLFGPREPAPVTS
ncbi:MAG: ester cyclase [Chloroflexi bacterium]|nr:ester cyclase [Chloroflexota bacterium]